MSPDTSTAGTIKGRGVASCRVTTSKGQVDPYMWLERVVNFLTARSATRSAQVTFLSVAILYALLLLASPVRVIGVWDVFTFLSAGWRINNGLIAHTDFYTPIGIVSYALVALGMRMSGLSVSAITYGTLVCGMVLSTWTWLIVRKRLSAVNGYLFTIFIALLVVAPRPLGWDFTLHTYAMLYNRIGWALFAMLCVQVLLPRMETRKYGMFIDGLSIGLLAGLIFYCKVSFLIAAVGAVVAALVLRRFPLRETGAVVVGFGIVVVAAFATLGIHPIDYIRDLSLAASAQSLELRIAWFKDALRDMAGWSFLVLLMMLSAVMVSPASDRKENRRELIRLGVLVAFLLGEALMIATGNATEKGQLPAFLVIGLVLLQYIAQQRQVMTTLKHHISATYLLCASIVIPIFFGLTFTSDAASIAYSAYWNQRRLPAEPASQRFASAVLADFHIPATAEWKTAYWQARYTPSRINEGKDLLARHVTTASRLFVVGLTDPFSYLMDLPPAKGVPLWWDGGFSFDSAHHPLAETVFGCVNLIIAPDVTHDIDGCCEEVVQQLNVVYGDYLGVHFSEVERTDHWILMVRNDSLAKPPEPFAKGESDRP